MNFPLLLKSNRKQKKISQGELAELVNQRLDLGHDNCLTQATISAWELGRQSPSQNREEVVREIATILEIDAKQLLDVWKTGKRSANHPDDQYLKDLRKWVARATSEFHKDNSYHPSIWMLGPRELPALIDDSTEKFEGTWKPNLAEGINYNLIWIADEEIKFDIFESLRKYLGEIDRDLESSYPDSKVNIYLLLPNKVKASISESLLFAFLKQKDFWDSAQEHRFRAEWIALSESSLRTRGAKEMWLEIFQELDEILTVNKFLDGRVALYRSPSEKRLSSAATIAMFATKANLEDKKSGHCYRWLDEEKVEALVKLVEKFEQWLSWHDSDPIEIEKVHGRVKSTTDHPVP